MVPSPACLGRTRLRPNKQDAHGRLSRLVENKMRLQTSAICHLLLFKSNDILVKRTPHSHDGETARNTGSEILYTKRHATINTWRNVDNLHGGVAPVITDQTIRYVDTHTGRQAYQCSHGTWRSFLYSSGVPRNFVRERGGFNKFSWGQRTEKMGIWGR